VAALPNKSFTAELPEIQLTNVGGQGGSTASELAARILRPLANRALTAASETGVRQYLGKGAGYNEEEMHLTQFSPGLYLRLKNAPGESQLFAAGDRVLLLLSHTLHILLHRSRHVPRLFDGGIAYLPGAEIH
jgi:hypothetical protein